MLKVIIQKNLVVIVPIKIYFLMYHGIVAKL